MLCSCHATSTLSSSRSSSSLVFLAHSSLTLPQKHFFGASALLHLLATSLTHGSLALAMHFFIMPIFSFLVQSSFSHFMLMILWQNFPPCFLWWGFQSHSSLTLPQKHFFGILLSLHSIAYFLAHGFFMIFSH